MDSALGWIGSLIEWFGQLFPRWVIVSPPMGALKFVGGKRVVALGPGVHWYWPVRTEFKEWPLARQAVDLRAQTICTSDDKTIVIGGMVVYEVKDLEQLLAHTYDPEETVREISLSAFHDVCGAHSWESLKGAQRSGALDRDLRREVKKGLDAYGVTVLKTMLTDLAPCKVIKLMQSMAKDGV